MAGGSLAFAVPDAASELLLRLVANFGGSPSELNITIVDGSNSVEFTDEKGEKLQGLTTACTAIANSCPSAAHLLGTTPESQAKVVEWLTFAITELTPLLDDKLGKVNDWLSSRTFLVGNDVTLADLVVYATVAPAASAFPVAQHGHFLNLLRWYAHIHAVADSKGLFPAATFTKPKLVPPPPPAPAAPKDKEAGKGKDKAAAAPPAPATSAASNSPAAAAPAEGSKKEKKKDKKKGADSAGSAAPATPAASTAPTPAQPSSDAASGPTVDVLDIRVGLITKVGPHPNADSLYLEEIDLGEGQPRQVVSGLRKFVPEEKMQNRRVVVVCNLKPAKMRDIMSYGMVLCASNADHTTVDPINPPEGAALGERITFEEYNGEPEAQINPKKKIFEKIAPDLVVSADGVCTYKGVAFSTSAGPVTATLPGAHIA